MRLYANGPAPKEVYFREIEAAGFTQVKAKPPLNLKENFLAVFQRRKLDTNSSDRTIEKRPR